MKNSWFSEQQSRIMGMYQKPNRKDSPENRVFPTMKMRQLENYGIVYQMGSFVIAHKGQRQFRKCRYMDKTIDRTYENHELIHDRYVSYLKGRIIK